MSQALVLDFDGSVAPLDGAETVPLRAREEEIRFACALPALRRLEIPPAKVAFTGSGDFHHVTFALLARVDRPVEVVVFDNHPDNMRYPFGIHCGSWVAHAARLPHVARIHVAGITSPDVSGAHAFENRLRPLRSGKVRYWCIRRGLRTLQRLGARASQSFDSIDALLDALLAEVRGDVYLSIDKDVLAPDIVRTNWDQGVMRLEELERAVAALQIVAADVTGDVSAYRYGSRWKRILSALDHQPQVQAEWQHAHREINRRLLALLT